MSGDAPPTTVDRLIHDANQIARFFAAQPRGDPAVAVAEHFRKFWAPSLRDALFASLDRRGGELSPAARRGLLLAEGRGEPSPPA